MRRSRATAPATTRAQPGGDPRLAPLHGPGHPQSIEHDHRGFAGDREHRQPPRAAQARPHAEDYPRDLESRERAYRNSWRAMGVRPGGSRHLYATLAQPVLLLLDVLFRLGPGRRFGAKAPRHQPEASCTGPRGQGPPPAPGGPVPGPDSSLGNNGDDRGHPFERPRGPGPSRKDMKASRCTWAMPSSRAIPALSPRRRVRAKFPDW